MEAALATTPKQDKTSLVIHLTTNRSGSYLIHDAPGMPQNTPQIIDDIDIGGGAKVRAVLFGHHLFVGPESTFPWFVWGTTQETHEGEPLVQVVVRGTAKPKVVEREYGWHETRPATWGGYAHTDYRREKITQEDCYLPGFDERSGQQFDPRDPKRLPYAYLTLDLTFPNGETQQVEWKFRLPRTGKVTVGRQVDGSPKLDVAVSLHGMTHQFTESFGVTKDAVGNDNYMSDHQTPAATLFRHLKDSTILGGSDTLWAAFLSQWHPDDSKTPTDNIASVYKRKAIAPNLARLEKENPLDWTFFRWLHDTATAGGKRNNQLLSAMLQEVAEDFDKLLGALRTARADAPRLPTAWTSYRPEMKGGLPLKRAICLTLPGVAEKVQAIEAQKDFRKQTTQAGQAEGLGVTSDKYPLLRAAIENSDLPIGVFNQPGKDGQPVNREFLLWERALSQPGWSGVLFEIAQNAASRSTYERDITPYLSFLFRICKYLDRHAPRKGKGKVWKAMPKFVKTESELEMAEADENTGTVKKRSALTPVADNETGIITVPYVALCVTGVRSQWCYSRHFYIFEEGFTDPESLGMVLRDLEPALNGRDDYGLCYYTLTGTDTARGYPTFLIIFEKRTDGLFVHFHRVRPCRSKEGVKTPACNLIEACYQYMAGNIPAKEITSQQGDLIFIKMDHDPIAAKAKVAEDPQTSPTLVFESHALQSLNSDVALTLHRSTAKTPGNRLGFVFAPNGLKVGHPEHDDIPSLTEGWYEIRRCKSWEANPKAIWSLTID